MPDLTSNNNSSRRIAWIDIARGIAILLMLWGHNSHGFFTHWLYYFHIPLFIFLSGYVFSPKPDFQSCLQHQTNRLYIPYICYFVIGYVLHWLYELLFYAGHPIIPHFWPQTYEILFPAYGTGVTNGLWFPIALSWIILLTQLLLLRNFTVRRLFCLYLALSIASIFISRHIYPPPFFFLQATALSIYFALGYLCKSHKNILNCNIATKLTITFISIAVLTIFTMNFPQIDYYKRFFPINAISCIGMAFIGIVGTVFLSQILTLNKILCSFLSVIGRITLWLLGLHGAVYRYLTPLLERIFQPESLLFCICRFTLAVFLMFLSAQIVIFLCRKYQLDKVEYYLGLK